MSDDLRVLRQKVDSLTNGAGDVRERLLNCLDVAIRRPADALALARGTGETLAKRILEAIGIKPPAMLEACLRELEKPEMMSRGLVPGEIITMLHKVRTIGNKALHDELRVKVISDDVASVLADVLWVTRWYFCEFTRGPRLDSVFRPMFAERTAIIRLVTQLGDRRLLTVKECKIPRCDMIESAQKIRDAITDTLLGLENDSASRRPLIDIRIACQRFQKFMEENSGEGRFQGESEQFFAELGELRGTTGRCLAELSGLNGIEIDRSLRHLLPGSAGYDV